MFEISKRFEFSAAHHLEQMPAGHPCRKPHGHNYEVVVVLRAKSLDEYGMVQDYGELDAFKDYLERCCDHQDLNESLPVAQPTAELMAEHFYRVCKGLWPLTQMVRVSETPKTWAMYWETGGEDE
jgi:6-pyruvoyltetrahydropterin/6-carboxytetrahydropterin synthase